MFQGYLLLADIDGTLFTKWPNRYVPQRNLDAIEEFMAQGGRFAVATGRSIRAAMRVLNGIAMNCPAIFYNGGCLYDTNREEIIWQAVLPEEAKEYLDIIHRWDPEIGIEIHREYDVYCVNESPESRRHVLNERDHFYVHNLQDVPYDGWNKMVFAASPEKISRLVNRFEGREYHGFYFVRSEEIYCELLPIEATKGKTLKRLANLLEIPIDKTCAIGDYYNDFDLISEAGIAAAVCSAPEQIKSLAQYVTCPCEQGAVADFIGYIKKIASGERCALHNI